MFFNILKGKNLLTMLVVLTAFSAPALAFPSIKNNTFLQYSGNERDWFYSGAFMAMGHAVAQQDKTKGICISKWYFENPKERFEEIDAAIQKHPDYPPSSVLIALAQRDCGKIGETE